MSGITRAPHAAGRGFTLIELLVVVAILAVAIAAIGACLAAGIRVWDVARDFGRIEADALLAIDEMRRDLRNAVALEAVPFAGERDAVRFGGIIRSSSPPATHFGAIHYRYDPETRQLIRETQVLAAGTRLESPRREARAGQVLNLRFTYAAFDAEREPTLSATTNLPPRVAFELVVDPGRGGAPLTLRGDVAPAWEGRP